MESFLLDARYALRVFARAPLFSLVAILTLAVGIGANAAVFGFVSALLLRPAPGVADPGSLVSVYTSDFSSGPFASTSYPDFASMQGLAAFERLAAVSQGGAALVQVDDRVERAGAAAVSGEFFAVVGVRPALGRLIAPADAGATAAPVAVIGHALWQRAFASDPAAVGRGIRIDGEPRTIVGVAPAGFEGLGLGTRVEVWTPLQADTREMARGNRGLAVVGRLRDAVSMREAQAQLDTLAAQLATAHPETNLGTLAQPDRPRPMLVLPHTRLHPAFRGEVAWIAGVLLGAVGLVLLMACANVAGLVLSRATARRREIAVRLALGATRRRLVRLMLTESVLLGAAGGGLGLLLALWTADALPSFFPPEQARMLDARVDARVLAFTALTAVLSGLLVGLAPALHGAKTGRAPLLREGETSAGGRFGSRSRAVLVGGQIAVASLLLISAALLARSLANAVRADLGYATREAVVASVELPASRGASALPLFYARAAETVGALPGVEAAALARWVPVAGLSRRGFRMEGYTPRPGEDTELHFNAVSRTYFATLRIPIAAGRDFDERDTAGAQRVAVVNTLLADRYFGGAAVGRRLTDSSGDALEIVGVVRADRRLSLQDPPRPVVFYPLEQAPARQVLVVARTAGAAAAAADAVRRALQDVDRDAAVFRTVTLEAHLGEALATNALTVALVAVCGGMALLLALVGVYGIVAYSVSRRTREIGLRVALGARPAQIFAMLMGESGRVVLAGLAAGLLAAAAATQFLGALLYGVRALDPGTFGAVPLGLAAIALLAAVAPALRALRLDPASALRHE